MEKFTEPSRRDEQKDKEFTLVDEGSRRFTKKELEYVEPEEQYTEYYVFPNYVKEMVSHKIPVVQDMADTGLTNFMMKVNPDSVEKKVSAMVRLRNANRIEPNKGKRLEYLIWYEEWSGTDNNGNLIPEVNNLPQGLDKTQKFAKMVDNKGREHYKTQGEPAWFYTVLYTPEMVDKILQDTNTDPESVSYTVQGISSWGGFSYDEFKNLEFMELHQRARDNETQGTVSLDKKRKGKQ